MEEEIGPTGSVRVELEMRSANQEGRSLSIAIGQKEKINIVHDTRNEAMFIRNKLWLNRVFRRKMVKVGRFPRSCLFTLISLSVAVSLYLLEWPSGVRW